MSGPAPTGFTGRLEPGPRPALLLVDPARAYVDPGCALYAGPGAAAEAIRELLGTARDSGVPVLITQQRVRADGSDGGLFSRKVPALGCFAVGNPFGELIDGVVPRADEQLVVKQYPSAFFGTPLQSALTANRVDTLVIGGFSTSGCVRATALDAMQHGFVPLVVEDAVGDRAPEAHAANLFDIRHKIGEVVALEQAQRYLRSCAQR